MKRPDDMKAALASVATIEGHPGIRVMVEDWMTQDSPQVADWLHGAAQAELARSGGDAKLARELFFLSVLMETRGSLENSR